MIKNIPTNIITGALGVGKTTLIQSLLANKPKHERWAILVNEFGEIGIDGAIFEGNSINGNEQQGVFVKEVPGGCMCCTSGLPMQIALNLLLAQANPDRLLIEPTGLGHPKEVMETLSAPHYRGVLDIYATLTLIDARKLADKKWREHEVFQQQMQIADIVIANKEDLYELDDYKALEKYLNTLQLSHRPVEFASRGKSPRLNFNPLNLLRMPSLYNEQRKEELLAYNDQDSLIHEREHEHSHRHPHDHSEGHLHGHDHSHSHERSHNHEHGHYDKSKQMDSTLTNTDTGITKVSNKGQGYYSQGWQWQASELYDIDSLQSQLTELFNKHSIERYKSVIQTTKGAMSLNYTPDGFDIRELMSLEENRMEFIGDSEQTVEKLSAELEKVFFG